MKKQATVHAIVDNFGFFCSPCFYNTSSMNWLQDHNAAVSNTLGSALAGIVSRIFTHPIDTAKSRLQAQYSPSSSSSKYAMPSYRGTFDALSKTFHAEGIHGLYRGFGAILVGGTPGTVAYLCTYEIAKGCLGDLRGNHEDNNEAGSSNFVVHFSAGMIAETVACIIYVPVDVIKERLQVQHGGHGTKHGSDHYKGSFDALKKIARTEGIAGVYKGYAATLASFGPYSALYFMFYEKFKTQTRQYLFVQQNQFSTSSSLDTMEIPFPWLVLCTASAGALASWLTSPLDMAKLRLVRIFRATSCLPDAQLAF